jgi:hypothetical protein
MRCSVCGMRSPKTGMCRPQTLLVLLKIPIFIICAKFSYHFKLAALWEIFKNFVFGRLPKKLL